MEHVLIGGNELFMTAGGKKNYTVEDSDGLPEGEREYCLVDPVLHAHSAKVKAGIYEDLVLDFGEYR